MNEAFTSQSGNFVSALQSHVDPRTGQFMVNLPLAKLVGNHQLGPELSLGLSYSPLYTQNNGFGIGFSLGVTQFNNSTNQLELSNGETYRVAAGTVNIRNKKLNTFNFSYTNGIDDAEGYTVCWKEGKREKLELIGGNCFVTSEIISPLDRKLSLSWNWSGQSPLLTTIEDQQTTLCSVTYEDAVRLTIWPGTQEAIQFMFKFMNGDQLSGVSRNLAKTETLEWSFEYSFVQETQKHLLSGVHYPTGKKDTVEYNTIQGHKFPESSGVSYQLPAVLSLTSNPGGGQPKTITYFEYTLHNFLGYNGTFGNWSADSDFIYTTLTDYAYGSTETVTDGSTTVSTVRTYNNYHLQISEETSRQNCKHRVDFTYYAKKDHFIESQPKQFQLMREKKETWTNENKATRTQTTLTEFDESGNPTKEVSPDGTETSMTWYAAGGEEGCHAEPNGFTRFMKEKIVTPRENNYDAPVMTTKYKYTMLGKGKNHVVQDVTSDYADDVLIHRRNFVYNESSGGTEYGRIIAISDTKYENGENSASFTSRQDFETVVQNGVMNQKTIVTGHDGIQVTSIRTQSILSGLLFSETDALGVTTIHSYDQLGRPLKRSVAPGTDYEDITTWSYSIEESGPVTTETDNVGNQTKMFFDGSGRTLLSQWFDADKTQEWFEVASQTYDTFGDVTNVKSSDWVTDKNDCYSIDTTFSRDGWGSLSTETTSDGMKKLKVTDPVAMIHSAYMQADGINNSFRGGTYQKTFDQKSFLPRKETRMDSSGREEGSKGYEWDGLGRLREERDELDQIIKRSYDVYGRVLTQTLPDGSMVTRAYAPHLTGEQVSSISVTGLNAKGQVQTWILGTQEFDSLGRITRRVCGGRATSYEYEGSSFVPSIISLPSGEKVVYTHIPELGNAVSGVTAKGINRKFSYDKKTGQLLSAEENNVKVENVWSTSGMLTEENFSQDGKTQKAASTYTLKGTRASYTDITGKQMQYRTDSLGRVTHIIDDALTVNLTYDPLGRLNEQIVRNTATSSFLMKTLNYDNFGRETKRVITNDHNMKLNVVQSWQKNGLLATRITDKNGTLLRTENYKYDSRNRLIEYSVTGIHLPVDSYGYSMTRQTYCYDALNNITSVVTILSDNTVDTASYLYENDKDPTQLTAIRHTHKNYPINVNLDYDAEGRMISDEAGRTLTYDVIGRLSSVQCNNGQSGSYKYDALDRLFARNADSNDLSEFFYRGDELVNEINPSQKKGVRLIKLGHTSLGVSDDNGLTLTTADSNDSLLWSVHTDKNEEGQLYSWSPYGSGKPDSRLPGYNGERLDTVSGTYHLGNGYRAYNPVLMRFNCPDSLSPFGAGGINPYAYCAGDPVNHMDPSGHLSWDAIFGIVMGVVGIGLAAFTAGASIAAAGGVMAAISSASATSLVVGGIGIASDITAIVSGALQDSHPEASSILGWVSLATGLVGMAAAVGGRFIHKKFKSWNLSRAKYDRPEYVQHRFKKAGEVEIRPRKGRPVTWHEHEVSISGQNYYKYGADTPIYGRDIATPLETIRSKGGDAPIVILSGTHGAPHGDNWIRRPILADRIGPRPRRGYPLKDQRFFNGDVYFYQEGRTVVKDLFAMRFHQFESYITGEYHVILGYCFGRNDQAYRSLLGLDPVPSYL